MYDFVKDELELFFEDEGAFDGALADFCKDTAWDLVKASDVHFAPIHGLADVIPEDVFKDSISGELPIAMQYDGASFAVRPFIFKAIKQHHRDGAKILATMLSKGHYLQVCEHLNMSAPYLTKNLMVMRRGGKIGGYFSQYNASWSQLTQCEYAMMTLGSLFKDLEFRRGEINHIFTSCEWSLGKAMADSEFEGSASISSAYLDAWESAGGDRKVLEEAQPICRFITGESGLTSIALSPTLKFKDGTTIYLGSSLSVNHRGSDESVWGKFEEFPSQIAALYQRGLMGLERLCKVKIFHPYNACSHALAFFKSAVTTSVLQNTLDDFEAFFSPDEKDLTCFAIDVYNHINNAFSKMDVKSPLRRVQNAELLARLLMCDWSGFDKSTPAHFGVTKVESPDWMD